MSQHLSVRLSFNDARMLSSYASAATSVLSNYAARPMTMSVRASVVMSDHIQAVNNPTSKGNVVANFGNSDGVWT